jgi:hypothetical protein
VGRLGGKDDREAELSESGCGMLCVRTQVSRFHFGVDGMFEAARACGTLDRMDLALLARSTGLE